MRSKITDYVSEEAKRINLICERVNTDPEVAQAITQLIRSTVHALDERAESYAWHCFQDRLQACITRATNK